MRKAAAFAWGASVAFFLGHSAWAQNYHDNEHAELAEAFKSGKISLAKGLAASEREGNPISGKFGVEHGQFQLSVYTAKANNFSEVIVDYKTGKIAKVERIASGDALTAAKEQSAAMIKAKSSLRAAIERAAKANKDYRPVSVTPTLKDGHPVAAVTLIKGEDSKTVTEKLD